MAKRRHLAQDAGYRLIKGKNGKPFAATLIKWVSAGKQFEYRAPASFAEEGRRQKEEVEAPLTDQRGPST